MPKRFTMSYGRRALLLLLLVLVVDYADRALIGALGPTLKSVYHISNTQLGLLAAAFGIVGAIATVPFGMLTDRVSRTTLLAVSLALWTLAEGATGAAGSFAMLFGARLLLGIVAATTGPTVPSLTGDLVRSGRRSRALGLLDSGELIGTGGGFLLAAVVAPLLSFRWCFWLLAVLGAALAVILWFFREPERSGAAGPAAAGGQPQAATNGRTKDATNGHMKGGHMKGVTQHHKPERPARSRVRELVRAKGIAPRQRAVLREDPAEMSMWDAARYVLGVRTDVIVLIARAVGDYFLAAVGIFGVIFATQQYRLSQRDADLAILGVGVGAFLGVLLGGRIADALLRRGWLRGRIGLGALGHLLAPFPLLPAFLTHTVALALPFFALGAFCLASTQPALDAVRLDVIVPGLRGRAESIRQVLRTAAEGGAPLVFGLIAGAISSGDAGLRLAFLITLPVLLVNGLILLLALRTYPPDAAAALASSEA